MSSSDSDGHGGSAASSPSSRGGHDGIQSSSAPAVESSARSSSESLRALRKEMASQLADKNLHLTPTLSQGLAFTRNQLRNAYLRLVFHAPFTKQAHNAELGMWTETTHKVVALYRSRLAKLEKLIKAPKDAPVSGSSSAAEGSSAKQPPTTPSSTASANKRRAQAQEYSRLAEALRNFLAKEEIFWKALAERLSIVFRLTETEGALDKAGITSAGPRIPVGPRAIMGGSGGPGPDSQPAGLARMPSSPSDLDPAVFKAASLPRHKDRLLEIVFKILLYCGDLARYREIYRDLSSVNSPATTPSRPARGGANQHPHRRAASAPATSQRDFTSAIVCYEAARLLLPSEGNPSNQLAVVSTYQGDNFGAVYHYYRALCVKRPFDTSKINLGAALGKAVDAWLQAGGLEGSSGRGSSGNDVKQRVTKDFVILQGLFFTHKSFTSLPILATRFLDTFEAAVSDRALSTDVIVRIVVVGIAASWTARLWRRTVDGGRGKESRSSATAKNGSTQEQDPKLALSIELQLLHHALGVFRVLLDVCTTQVRQALEDAKALQQPASQNRRTGGRNGAGSNATTEGGAAKHMTAVMRRVLPALRISSKWVKAHLDYIDRCEGGCISRAAEGFSDVSGGEASRSTLAARAAAELSLIQGVEDFWTSYVDCINTLRFAFPFDSLPSLGTVGLTGAAALALEEDVDLRGFVPTRRGMLKQDDAAALKAGAAGAASSPRVGGGRDEADTGQRHPNEEHLMRIADLLVDAKVVAESEASPILFDDARGTFRVDPSAKAAHINAASTGAAGVSAQGGTNALQPSQISVDSLLPGQQRRGSQGGQSLDSTETTTTEDIVDLAMRHVAAQQGKLDGRHHLPDGLVSDDDEDDRDDDERILIPSTVIGQRRLRNTGGSPAAAATPTQAPALAAGSSAMKGFPSSFGGASTPQQHASATSPSGLFGMGQLYGSLPLGGAASAPPMQQGFPPQPSPAPAQQQQQQPPSMRTAQDLLLNMLQGGGGNNGSNSMGAPSSPAAPSLLFGGVQPQQSSPFHSQHQHANLASIWAPAPGEVGRGRPSASGSGSLTPGAQQHQQHQQSPIGTAAPGAQRRDPWGMPLPSAMPVGSPHFYQGQQQQQQQGHYQQQAPAPAPAQPQMPYQQHFQSQGGHFPGPFDR